MFSSITLLRLPRLVCTSRKALRLYCVTQAVIASMIGSRVAVPSASCQLSAKHRDHDAAQQQDIGGEFDQAVGDRLIDGVSVVRDAAHQVAHRVVIVIGHRQASGCG